MNVWIIVIVVIIFILLFIGATYNGLVGLRNKVKDAFSGMDVYLAKRSDLVPNLVKTVQGYAKHEKATLDDVISARNSAVNAKGVENKVDAENQLTGSLNKLFALAESYPDLKANTNFLDLQSQLNNIETEIAQSRKYYNGSVRMLNNKVEGFPSNIVAKLFNFKTYDMFKITNEKQRENVKVEF